MLNKFSQKDGVIYLYYLARFLVGLRFFIPIWLLFGLRFFDLSGLALIESITYFVTVIVDVPSGALADIIGRKRVIIIGLAILGLGHIFLGMSGTIWDYVLWSLLTNIGASFIAGADTALLYDHLKEYGESEKFIKVQSFAISFFRLGIIIASFLGGWLYNILPALPFVIMGICELAAILCWIFIKEPKLDSEKFKWGNYIVKIRTGFTEIFKTESLRPLTAFYVLIGGITLSSVYFFSFSYAWQLGFDANAQSVLFGFSGIAKAIVAFTIGMLAVKFTRGKIFVWFAILAVLTYLPAAFAPLWLGVLIITASETLGSARMALLDKFVNDELSSQHRATALSAINMLINLFYLILVGLGGLIANKYGTSVLYSIFGIILLLVALPLAIKLNSQNPQKNN